MDYNDKEEAEHNDYVMDQLLDEIKLLEKQRDKYKHLLLQLYHRADLTKINDLDLLNRLAYISSKNIIDETNQENS